MITNELRFKRVLAHKVLLAFYDRSIAGNAGVTDYSGCLEKQGDIVWLMPGNGKLLCDKKITIIRDEYIYEDALSNAYSMDSLVRKLATRLQVRVDKEMLENYTCLLDNEFGFAAQLSIKFGEMKSNGKTSVEMELIYGHKKLHNTKEKYMEPEVFYTVIGENERTNFLFKTKKEAGIYLRENAFTDGEVVRMIYYPDED